MSTILVTGANGFIGSHVAEHLHREGHNVRGLVRRTSDLKFIEDLDIELCFGDITDLRTLEEPVEGAEIVVHVERPQSVEVIHERPVVEVIGKASGPDELSAGGQTGTDNSLHPCPWQHALLLSWS